MPCYFGAGALVYTKLINKLTLIFELLASFLHSDGFETHRYPGNFIHQFLNVIALVLEQHFIHLY